MEKLTINIPDDKSILVKQILKGLGVTIQPENHTKPAFYKDKLAKISIWSEDDVNALTETKHAFQNLRSEQW
jgi:hypothetical protein